MRCDNCGWNNPDNLEKCQKCNQDLRPVIAEVQKINEPEAIEQPSAPKVFKETTLDAERFMASNNKAVKPSVCPECCYPLMPDTDVCPNCGRTISDHSSVEVSHSVAPEIPELPKPPVSQKVQPEVKESCDKHDMKKTVLEYSSVLLEQQNSKLVPLDNFDGKSSPVVLTGESLSIGRKDFADDPTVSDEHCAFEYEDGKWYVRDTSGQRATFVLATRRIEIQKGDVVVIGNRRFVLE